MRLAAAAFVLFSVVSVPDRWERRERQFDSANGQWRMVVTVEGRASIRRKVAGGWRQVAQWTIRNAALPALIANSGAVVTFESTDTGRAVVIHRLNGTVVRELRLADLVEDEDLSWFPRSTTSTDWQGTHRIDDEQRLLIVQIDAGGRSYETAVRLDTGELLAPKLRVFPDSAVSWKANDAMSCSDGAVPLSPGEVAARVVDPVVPKFPPIARRARILGHVVAEVLIDERGTVTRTTVLKSLPFGMDSEVVVAASRWRFRAAARPSCAQLVFQFGQWPTAPVGRSADVP
jgi:TonB family protein